MAPLNKHSTTPTHSRPGYRLLQYMTAMIGPSTKTKIPNMIANSGGPNILSPLRAFTCDRSCASTLGIRGAGGSPPTVWMPLMLYVRPPRMGGIFAGLTPKNQPRSRQMRFYTKQQKYYCAIDLHTKKKYVCILGSSGKIMA